MIQPRGAAATIPKKALQRVTAGALDATAFETAGRTRDYSIQQEVDKAVREALKAGDEAPSEVILGENGKVRRSRYDPKAEAAYRTASSATGHKPRFFAGYYVTSVSACRDYHWPGDPAKVHLREHVGPYILAFSLAPAARDKGPIARIVVAALKQSLPRMRTVTTDREFSDKRASFVNPLHDMDIAVIMDYQRPFTAKFDMVTLPNGELVYSSCGDHYPLRMPQEFHGAPGDNLTEAQKHDWHERRAAFRYSSNGRLNNGSVQNLCPQCAGRVIYAEKTRMGKYKNAPHPDSALSFGPPLASGYCCLGSVTLSGDELRYWQPVPWGTRAHKKLYDAGRNQIENSYSLVKEDGAISNKACRAPRTAPHNMAFLAMAVVNNVQFADADPDADPQPDDTPRALPSLYCVTPAFQDNPSDSAHQSGPANSAKDAQSSRDPP